MTYRSYVTEFKSGSAEIGTAVSNVDDTRIIVITMYRPSYLALSTKNQLDNLYNFLFLEEDEEKAKIILKTVEGRSFEHFIHSTNSEKNLRIQITLELLKKMLRYDEFPNSVKLMLIAEDQVLLNENGVYLRELVNYTSHTPVTEKQIVASLGATISKLLPNLEGTEAVLIDQMVRGNNNFRTIADVYSAFRDVFIYRIPASLEKRIYIYKADEEAVDADSVDQFLKQEEMKRIQQEQRREELRREYKIDEFERKIANQTELSYEMSNRYGFDHEEIRLSADETQKILPGMNDFDIIRSVQPKTIDLKQVQKDISDSLDEIVSEFTNYGKRRSVDTGAMTPVTAQSAEAVTTIKAQGVNTGAMLLQNANTGAITPGKVQGVEVADAKNETGTNGLVINRAATKEDSIDKASTSESAATEGEGTTAVTSTGRESAMNKSAVNRTYDGAEDAENAQEMPTGSHHKNKKNRKNRRKKNRRNPSNLSFTEALDGFADDALKSADSLAGVNADASGNVNTGTNADADANTDFQAVLRDADGNAWADTVPLDLIDEYSPIRKYSDYDTTKLDDESASDLDLFYRTMHSKPKHGQSIKNIILIALTAVFLVAVFIVAFLFFRDSRQPVIPNFEITQTSLSNVKCKNTSSGKNKIAKYSWQVYQDKVLLAEEGVPEPQFSFKDPGTFTIRLTVTDKDGKVYETVSKSITVTFDIPDSTTPTGSNPTSEPSAEPSSESSPGSSEPSSESSSNSDSE